MHAYYKTNENCVQHHACRYTFKDDHNQACVRKLISEVQALNPSFEARDIRGMYMYTAQFKS